MRYRGMASLVCRSTDLRSTSPLWSISRRTSKVSRAGQPARLRSRSSGTVTVRLRRRSSPIRPSKFPTAGMLPDRPRSAPARATCLTPLLLRCGRTGQSRHLSDLSVTIVASDDPEIGASLRTDRTPETADFHGVAVSVLAPFLLEIASSTRWSSEPWPNRGRYGGAASSGTIPRTAAAGALAGSLNDEPGLRSGRNRGSRRLPRRRLGDGRLVRARRARQGHGLSRPYRGRARGDRGPSPAQDDRVDRIAQQLDRRRRGRRARDCRDLDRLFLGAYRRADLDADPRLDP